MGGRVLLAFPGVSSPGHDGMLMHEDRPHGHFAVGSGEFRFPQGFAHEGFIGREIMCRCCFEGHDASIEEECLMNPVSLSLQTEE